MSLRKKHAGPVPAPAPELDTLQRGARVWVRRAGGAITWLPAEFRSLDAAAGIVTVAVFEDGGAVTGAPEEMSAWQVRPTPGLLLHTSAWHPHHLTLPSTPSP